MTTPDGQANDCTLLLLKRLEALAGRLEAISSPAPEFVTVAEASRRMGIGEKALRSAVRRGEVRAFALGTAGRGRPRVRLAEVREWAMGTVFDPQSRARRAGELAARALGGGRASNPTGYRKRSLNHG